MSKRFLLIIAALAAVFVGIIIFTKHDKPQTTSGGNSSGSSHIQGKGNSGVTLVEFGDYQCPACAAYYPLLKQLQVKYNDQIKFQFRNFPLVSIHKNAMAAARAAEAAGKQDKFWEMHDLIYERQKTWEESGNAAQIFEDYATELGMNIDKYHQDINSSEINDIINADVKAAQDLGASGTPTFVLDGVRLDPAPQDINSFSKAIDDAIAKKSTS